MMLGDWMKGHLYNVRSHQWTLIYLYKYLFTCRKSFGKHVTLQRTSKMCGLPPNTKVSLKLERELYYWRKWTHKKTGKELAVFRGACWKFTVSPCEICFFFLAFLTLQHKWQKMAKTCSCSKMWWAVNWGCKWVNHSLHLLIHLNLLSDVYWQRTLAGPS